MTTILTFRREIPLAPDGPGGSSGGTPSTPSGGGASPSGSTPGGAGAPSTPSAPSGAPSSPGPSSPSSTPSRGAPSPTVTPPTSVPGRSYGPKGTPTPVAKPAEPPFDFSTLFDGPTDLPAVEVPQGQQPQQPLGAPQVPQAGQPPMPGQQPVQGQPGVAPPGGQRPPPGAQRPVLDPAEPMSLARALVVHEQAAIEHAAQALFKLTNEEVEALETNVIGTIPRLLGKVMIKMQQQQLAQMSRIVPLMIGRYANTMLRHSSNENKFYAAWPGIDRHRHGDLVRKYGAVYRAMNPHATLDGMIRELGPMVMAALSAQPGAVASTPRPGNGAGPRQMHQPSAFVPASGGPSGVQSAPGPGVFDFLGYSE